MSPPRQIAQSLAQSPWACISCQGAARQHARRSLLDAPVFRRKLSSTTARRAQPQDRAAAPSMHRMREHYNKKNRTVMYDTNTPVNGSDSLRETRSNVWDQRAKQLTGFRNYTMSLILGTVALSYGSVPMYKMVCMQSSSIWKPID